MISGGLHIKTYKSRSRYKPIENLPLPGEVMLYTSQHIGAPSEPEVSRGDTVKRGQMIARGLGGCSASLHASISGKVRSVGRTELPGGGVGNGILIKKDGDQTVECMEPLEEITPRTIRERVREAGIVGMGGAGFPTHIKLNPPKPVHTSILNGCECEPYLTADERLMVEEAEKVVKGFVLMRDAAGARKGVIGIEDDKPDAVKELKRVAAHTKGVEVEVLPKKYPQGYEKVLIKAVTGKEVPSGGLPHDVGVSVHNVGTCLAVHDAVYEGKPLIERVLTLTGPLVPEPVNLRVPLGMKISEIFDYYRIESGLNFELISGGPMMGLPLDSAETAATKTTSGILVKDAVRIKEQPCVRCGKCVEACPTGLVPQVMNFFYGGEDIEAMENRGLKDCMECGCCTYVCPSRIPLTVNFKTAKQLR